MLEALPVAAPALPLDEAGKYVAAAYIVAEQRSASQAPRERAETPSRDPQVEAVAEELHR